jgi:NitT/TauT family transport system permease protein
MTMSPPMHKAAPAPPPRLAMLAAEKARRQRNLALMPWFVGAVAVLGWEIACRAFDIPIFLLPAPSDIAASIVRWWNPLLGAAMQTLGTTLAGFALAVVFGVTLGVLVGSSSTIYHGLFPLIIAFESVPKVAVVPLLVIWFGIGTIPAIITSFLIAFFPIMVNVSAGVASVEPELRDVLRSLGARPIDIVRKVGIPRSAPYFFASLKLAITASFIGSIISETVGSNAGIGHLIIVASSRFDVPLVFAGLVATAVMGVTMYAISTAVERRSTRWSTR